MEIYLVGGAVRDQLLGISSQDRDWVVVGSSAPEMIKRGYKPVGRDFPVFLHPETKEEYALARTERKSGKGYHGFTFYAASDVTLEEDLRRRDLTINAMAMDGEGRLIDPFGGKRDLSLGVLRHISPAFSEDPLRILRTARFMSIFGFKVAPETLSLIATMVKGGELLTLSRERVGGEFMKGMGGGHLFSMLAFLQETGVAAQLFPELVPILSAHRDELKKLFSAAEFPAGDAETRLALLVSFITTHELAARFLARLALSRGVMRRVLAFWQLNHTRPEGACSPAEVLNFFEENRAFRYPEEFRAGLKLLAEKTHVLTPQKNFPAEEMSALFAELSKIDLKTLAAKSDPRAIPERIHSEREKTLAVFMRAHPEFAFLEKK